MFPTCVPCRHNGAVNIVERGSGRAVLLIHGSAADAMTWSIQLATLARELRVVAYDRRDHVDRIADHVADAVGVLDRLGIAAAVVAGASFGSVVALELARQHPGRVEAVAICEPPLPSSDSAPFVPLAFGCGFERALALRGGPAAGEFFLRAVLGAAAFERLPETFRMRACAKWDQIRHDCRALAAYRVGYDRLRIEPPVALLGGERSAPWYRDTLDALGAALGAEVHTLGGAGHMLHADAARAFNDHLLRLAGGAT
jgi:3-oxoadipate enol-lactonase